MWALGGVVLSFWTTNLPLPSRFHLSLCGSLNIDIIILSLLTSPSLSSLSHSRLLLMSWANSSVSASFPKTFLWVADCILCFRVLQCCDSLHLPWSHFLWFIIKFSLILLPYPLPSKVYINKKILSQSSSNSVFSVFSFAVARKDINMWLFLHKSKTEC